MINQFRKYTQINIPLLVVFGALLCFGAFLHVPEGLEIIVFEPVLANLIGQPISIILHPGVNVLLTLVFTISQALLLNITANTHGLFGKPNYLPALMYVAFASLLLPFLVLSPIIICNFISVWVIQKLLLLYRSAEVKGIMFDLGLIVALGSLIYFPFIGMLAMLWISLSIFRAFNWREWVIPLIGFGTVYFLLGVAYFLLDKLDEFYAVWEPFSQPMATSIDIELHDMMVLLPVAFILVLFLFVLKQLFSKNVVHVRKTIKMLFYMIVVIVASFFLNSEFDVNHFLLCVPAVAIYAAYYFTLAEKRWLYEGVFVLLVLAIIYFQYF